MDPETLAFFDRSPAALPLYEAFLDVMRALCPDASVRVQRSQISFSDGCGFAFISLPQRRIAACPRDGLILTLGLRARLDSPRVFQVVEPYPGRWTHHFILRSAGDLDAQMRGWIVDAHEYAVERGARRKK